jgi:hypothetical protein
MFKLAPTKIIAALSFATALGGSLIILPLVIDGQALAFDAKSGGGADDGPSEHHHLLPSELVEPRLAFLKTALKITDAQSKQWSAFADVMRKQAKEKDAMVTALRAYKDANLTVIDRMEQRQKMLSTAAANLSDLIAAAQPLYASFSDEQKQLANEFLAPHFGHHFGHGGFGEHFRGDR